MCVVLTYRSDELHRRHPLRPLLAELERAAGVERVGLERFDRAEVAEQLAGILQAPPPGDADRAALHPRQGNPLYIEELLAASGDGEEWLLPESLRDALLSRIERLTPSRAGGRSASPPCSTARCRIRCSRRSPSSRPRS